MAQALMCDNCKSASMDRDEIDLHSLIRRYAMAIGVLVQHSIGPSDA